MRLRLLLGAVGGQDAQQSVSILSGGSAPRIANLGVLVAPGCEGPKLSEYASGAMQLWRYVVSSSLKVQMVWGEGISEYNLLALGGCLVVCLSLGAIASAQPALPKPLVNRDKVQTLKARGKSLAAEGRLAEAEEPLLEAEKLAPDDVETITVLAQVQGRIGKSAQAIAGFRKAVDLSPRDAEAHLNLCIALADGGKLVDALTESSRAVELAPRMAEAHLNRGRILDDLHRADEAEKEFTTAYKLSPSNPDCLYYWALVEREVGHLSKESELLKKMTVMEPTNYKAAYSLGRSLVDQSRHTEAIEALRRSLSIKPDYQDALYLLSRELRKSAPEESRQLDDRFQAARQSQAILDRSKSLGNEAYAAAGKRDWPEAIRLLKQALEVCTQCEASAGLHKNLGLALCRNGDIEQGRTELEMSLKINPNDPDVVKALEVLGH